MKKLNHALTLSLLAFALPIYADEQMPEQELPSDEIALLEPTVFAQQPSFQEELDITLPSYAPQHKSSFLTMGLSALCPGLGHAYLGEYATAGSLFGSSALFLTFGSGEIAGEEFTNSNLVALQNTWFYSMYAAYRDVRAYNGGSDYKYKMPTESLSELAWAPFQWSVIRKPEVWGGFLGALTVGAGIGYFLLSQQEDAELKVSTSSTFPLLAFPVGIGEESFFRGFLQPMLAERVTPWGGIILSSLLFGAMHLGNGLAMEPDARRQYYSVSIPFITSFGVYFGWIAYKNNSLKEGVALHSWYDFALFMASYSLAQSASIRKPSFAISIPF
jgi:membrane protease YdiL (CAAX protease family)